MANLKNSVAKNIKTKVAGQTQDDVVYCHIFDAILEQRLPPATKLNEEALAEIFSVSRTIIRRALAPIVDGTGGQHQAKPRGDGVCTDQGRSQANHQSA